MSRNSSGRYNDEGEESSSSSQPYSPCSSGVSTFKTETRAGPSGDYAFGRRELLLERPATNFMVLMALTQDNMSAPSRLNFNDKELDKDLYGLNSSYIQNLNILRRKLNLEEINENDDPEKIRECTGDACELLPEKLMKGDTANERRSYEYNQRDFESRTSIRSNLHLSRRETHFNLSSVMKLQDVESACTPSEEDMFAEQSQAMWVSTVEAQKEEQVEETLLTVNKDHVVVTPRTLEVPPKKLCLRKPSMTNAHPSYIPVAKKSSKILSETENEVPNQIPLKSRDSDYKLSSGYSSAPTKPSNTTINNKKSNLVVSELQQNHIEPRTFKSLSAFVAKSPLDDLVVPICVKPTSSKLNLTGFEVITHFEARHTPQQAFTNSGNNYHLDVSHSEVKSVGSTSSVCSSAWDHAKFYKGDASQNKSMELSLPSSIADDASGKDRNPDVRIVTIPNETEEVYLATRHDDDSDNKDVPFIMRKFYESTPILTSISTPETYRVSSCIQSEYSSRKEKSTTSLEEEEEEVSKDRIKSTTTSSDNMSISRNKDQAKMKLNNKLKDYLSEFSIRNSASTLHDSTKKFSSYTDYKDYAQKILEAKNQRTTEISKKYDIPNEVVFSSQEAIGGKNLDSESTKSRSLVFSRKSQLTDLTYYDVSSDSQENDNDNHMEMETLPEVLTEEDEEPTNFCRGCFCWGFLFSR